MSGEARAPNEILKGAYVEELIALASRIEHLGCRLFSLKLPPNADSSSDPEFINSAILLLSYAASIKRIFDNRGPKKKR